MYSVDALCRVELTAPGQGAAHRFSAQVHSSSSDELGRPVGSGSVSVTVQEVVGVARVALDPGLPPGSVERKVLGRRGVRASAAHQEQRMPAGSRGQQEAP